MKHLAWLGVLVAMGCTVRNPSAVGTGSMCGAVSSCPTGGRTYRACNDGATCSFAGSDGSSFSCVSCADCVAAASQVAAWCATGGGTTGGGTTGGGTTGGGTTGGGTTGGGTTGGGTTGGGTTGGGTTGGGTTGGPAVSCPAVMIILDRSGSMDADFTGGNGGGTSKLEAAKTAIKTLVQTHGDRFAFGLETFTDESVTPACDSGVDVLVQPGFNTSSQIQTKVSPVIVGGTTNTGAALHTANTNAALLDAQRPSHSILLITDGAPNCAGNATDVSGAVAEVSAGLQAGVVTFIVGLGTLAAEDVTGINQMAQACPPGTCSGTTCNGESYFPAASGGAINTTADAILAKLEVAGCNR